MWRMIVVDTESQSLISTGIHMLMHPYKYTGIHMHLHSIQTRYMYTHAHTTCIHMYTYAHTLHTNTHMKMCTRGKNLSISNFLPSTFPQ